MTVVRHHADWLSLVDISGPFLSLQVLLRVFPQQLPQLDSGLSAQTRLAFTEWEDAAGDRAIHTAWLQYVLGTVLKFPDEVLLTGQGMPPGLEFTVAEHGETLRPQWAIKRQEDERPAMLVVGYPPDQGLDKPAADAGWRTASPATRMMTLLQGTNVPIGLVTNGAEWMLVAVRPGEATTFVTWDAALWNEEPITLRAFSALLGVHRAFSVADSDKLPSLLVESLNNQQEVTDQLGTQVRKAVEVLVQAVDQINLDRNGRLLAGIDEKVLYQAALTVMMRLVFVLSAEERGLLLLGDPIWDRNYAVSTLRDQLVELPDENLLMHRYDAWSRLLSTFRAIYGGIAHDQLRLPAYGGDLFDPDRFPFLEGRAVHTRWHDTQASPLEINNRTVLHLLQALQFLEMPLPGGGGRELRRLSFRALDIEQIGHVYEGLLDHTAKRAASTVLGLRGSSGDDVEVELNTLEEKKNESDEALVSYLKERTGRQANAIRNALNRAEPPDALALQTACAGHDRLYDRIAPYAHLLRNDSAGHPVVIHAGSIFVTKGTDRRSSGTHYTPRSLTEPVVKTTLEPLLYTGVSEGRSPSLETLRSPTEILSLRVCDPACGSGAFLVQACRYMSERLVEAWSRAEAGSPNAGPLYIPEALPANANHTQQLLPTDPDERLALARRLVTERCLYGVDFNPMAVEMAKLSLWLVTLHKQRPFTFLDHAIKCGDSLLGVYDPLQLERFHLVPGRTQHRVEDYLLGEVRGLLAQARARREELERFTVLDVRDAELKASLHQQAEEALNKVRLLADLVVGAGLSTAGSDANRSANLLDSRLAEILLSAEAILAPPVEQRRAAQPPTEPELYPLRLRAEGLLGTIPSTGVARRPFHWAVEFPEVFTSTEHGGFDALIGNPPFVGGQKITGSFGTDFRDYLVLYLADGRRGSADLCAYFFLRAVQVLRPNGAFGLLAVNTIAEGDTRQVGLEAMLQQGITIFEAGAEFSWPGEASLMARAVQGVRGEWEGFFFLGGEIVPTISAFLSSEDEWSPIPLEANKNKSFIGSYVLGMGFTLSPEDARALIENNPQNAEALFPYLSGDDLNSISDQKASRWVINFWDWPLDRSVEDGIWTTADVRQRDLWLREGKVPTDYPGRVAEDFPELLGIVRRLVKPERDALNQNNSAGRNRKQRWWRYGSDAKSLYHAIGRGAFFAKHPNGWKTEAHVEKVLAFTLHSKYWCLNLVSPGQVFSHALGVIASDSFGTFALLQSNIHGVWAWNFSSSLETRLRYTPSDVFETFPFPPEGAGGLDVAGQELFEMRSSFLIRKNIGLTKFMNEFHNPEQADEEWINLRSLICSVDVAVLSAYGWSDIDLAHDFHEVSYLPQDDRIRFTIAEPARLEVLRRLAALNRQRHQEEQAAAQNVQAVMQASQPRRRARLAAVQENLPEIPPAQADLF